MAKILSIEIGASLTEVCEMDYKSKNPKVYKSLMISTPEDVLDDGVLVNFDAFADALRSMLKKRGFGSKKVVFTVSSGKIASREVEIPYIKTNQIKDLIISNASDYFPVDLSEYSISYSLLETLTKEDGTKGLRINALAIPHELLDSYREFAKAAGLELEAVDYDGNSLYQAVRKECAVGNQIVVKIDEFSSIVTVMKDGIQNMTRTVPYGMNDAISAVIESQVYSTSTSRSQAISYLRAMKCVNPTFENRQSETKDDNGFFSNDHFDNSKYNSILSKNGNTQGSEGDFRFDGSGQNVEMTDAGDHADDGKPDDSVDVEMQEGNPEKENEDENTPLTKTKKSLLGSLFSMKKKNAGAEKGELEKEELAEGTVQEEVKAGEEEQVSEQIQALRDEVTASFENMVSGISTVLDLYYSRNAGQHLDRVVLTGMGGTIQGLAGLVSRTLDVPVETIHELEGVQVERAFHNGVYGEYIGCIGAALNPVDFLAVNKISGNGEVDMNNIAKIVFCSCLVISAALTVVSVMPYLNARNANDTLKMQVRANAGTVSIYQEYTLAKQENDFLELAYASAEVPADSLVDFIEEMEEKMPSNLLITSLSADASTITLSINVSTKEEATETIEQFRTFESLSEVAVDSMTDTYAPDNTHMITFNLVGTYKTEASAATEGSSGEGSTAGASTENGAAAGNGATTAASAETTTAAAASTAVSAQ